MAHTHQPYLHCMHIIYTYIANLTVYLCTVFFYLILYQRVINNMNTEAQDRCADETIQGQPPHVPNDDEFLQMGQQQLPDILQHVCYAFFILVFFFFLYSFVKKSC